MNDLDLVVFLVLAEVKFLLVALVALVVLVILAASMVFFMLIVRIV
jgi:hypothetical protein